MRSRKEIEDELASSPENTLSEKNTKLWVELTLDIRQLLDKINDNLKDIKALLAK